MIEKIVALSELGWSIRRISRELGVHRDTVKKHRLPEKGSGRLIRHFY